MFLNFQKIWHKKWPFIYERKSVYNDDLRINMNLKRFDNTRWLKIWHILRIPEFFLKHRSE